MKMKNLEVKYVVKIKITGDTHGEQRRMLDYIDAHKKSPDFDMLLICGDFGYIFRGDRGENSFLNYIEKEADFDIVFVDGNHCLSKDTEILTENGWMHVEDVYNLGKSIKIANMDLENHFIKFNFPLESYRTFVEKGIEFSGKYISQFVSPEHNIIVNGKKYLAKDFLGKKIDENDFIYFGNTNNKIELDDNWIKLLTWVIMDATIIDYNKRNPNSQKCTIQWKLSRNRKILALEQLLNNMEIPYTKQVCKKYGLNKLQPYYIRIYSDSARKIYNLLNKEKTIPKEWKNFSRKQLETFLDVLKITDGSECENNKCTWTTVDKNAVDVIQEACIKNGIAFTYNNINCKSGFDNGKIQYSCRICPRKKENTYYINPEEKEYYDNMYCWTMPYGTLIIRRQGKVCITGNCNFPEIYSYPIEKWNGGLVHTIRKNIRHLMRGEIYTFGSKTFFTFGGGYSIDKEFRLRHEELYKRKVWWKEEFPTQEEINHAFSNLESHNWKVNYIITHSAPTNVLPLVSEFFISSAKADVDIVNSTLETIRQKTVFDHWFFGHYHGNKEIDDKFTILYEISRNIEV